MDKATLRKKYKLLREKYSPEEIDQQSIAIANNCLELPIWNATNYHLFLPISNKKEVNTEFILQILQGRDKSVILPKVDFKTSELTHYLLQENTELRLSAYGIPEPTSGITIHPETIDVVFVPLLAFDSFGNRVGYGKGFYDRFLAQCGPNAIFVGLSLFDSEKYIAHSSNDIPLHYCVCPSQVHAFKSPTNW